MKNLKKILISFILILVALFQVKSVNASTTTTSDNGKGSWTPNKTETTEIYGMEHQSVWGNANDSKPQHINVLSMKTDGYSSKLVTWSVTEGNRKYTRQNLDVIAKDYEEKHPGWIVIGGINADQYTTGFGSDLGAGSAYFTPQTYYPLIMDGEARIPYTAHGITNMHVGFANDGSENSLIASSDVIGYKLTIVDEYKNELQTFKVNKVNEEPGADETTVWSTYISISNMTKYVTKEISSDKDIYIIENPELAYMSNTVEYRNGVDSFFGKGIISKADKTHMLINNQFAIETNNQELINALNINTRIIVEAEYESEELNKVEASTGYHSVHRYNNEDQALVHTDYDGKRYSRAIIGKKADGTYVLLTVDVATDPNDLTIRYAGMGFDECNATLKHYGVVEAYQMDGGGSVTSILRNKSGNFDYTNYPRDGVRANMTGLLFVVRDSELQVSDETNHHSITFDHNKIINGINSTVENIVIKYNGKEYKENNSKITIDGLEENTNYEFDCTYDVISGNNKVTYHTSLQAKTKLFTDVIGEFKATNIKKTNVTIEQTPNENVINAKVLINGSEYHIKDNKVVINELMGDTEYIYVVEYDVIEPATNKKYHRITNEMVVKTSSFEIPEVVKFEIYRETKNRIIFSYEYVDEDSVVTKAQIVYNGQIYELASKRGTATISNLDLENKEYTFKIELTYLDQNKEEYIYSSEIKAGTSQITPVEIKHNITYVLDGGINESNAPVEYVEGIGLDVLPTPTKEGYNFLGWYVGEEKIEQIGVDAKEDLTLTAKWEKIIVKHTITYILDGGINESNAPVEYVEGVGLETLPTPTKEGYNFLGWYNGDEKVEKVSDKETLDLTLTAKWEKKAEEKPVEPDKPTEPEKPSEPTENKKGCGCGCGKSASIMIMLSAVLACALIIFRKRR